MSPEQQFATPIQSQAIEPVAMPQPLVVQSGYAGFWLRYLAFVVDIVILFIVVNLIRIIFFKFVFAEIYGQPIGPIILFQVTILLVYLGYFIIFTYKQQATIGKKLLGLRVVAEDGSRLSLGKIIFRETIGKILSLVILGIGYFMAGFTVKKQALHDKMVGSVVISNPAERKQWAFVLSIIFVPTLLIYIMLGL